MISVPLPTTVLTAPAASPAAAIARISPIPMLSGRGARRLSAQGAGRPSPSIWLEAGHRRRGLYVGPTAE